MAPDDLQSKIRELESLRSQTRWWGWGTTLAITLIAFVSVGLLVSAVHSLFQEGAARDEFTQTLSSRLQRDVLPQVQQIASQTLTESKPEVEAAFSKLNTHVPELTTLSLQQLDLLKTNIPARGSKALGDTYGAVLKKHEPKIREMFPEATEKNVSALVSAMTEEGQRQMVLSDDKLFSKHLNAMNGIVLDLDKIKQTETVTSNADQANWEMALTVVDAFHDDLHNLQADGAAAKTEGKGTEKGTKK